MKNRSLSARRAWIEITDIDDKFGGLMVALRKESVDRNLPDHIDTQAYLESLSARRAWIEICGGVSARPLAAVALRKESVDRNTSPHSINYMTHSRSPQGERG